MNRKFFTFFVLIIVTALAFLGSLWFESAAAKKVLQSLITITLLYGLISIGIGGFFARRLSDSKTRYSFRKAVSMILIGILAIVLLRIWVPNPQALLVAYGVVAAGIAVALQDLVKNIAGGLSIFISGVFRVGNRIEMNGVVGDVIDIGLFNTTLLEVRAWIDADQATGRIVTVPNGSALNKPVHNYTKHHQYLWDELNVVVTPESNWSEAMRLMGEIGLEHTSEFVDAADQSLTQLERYYYVEGHVLDPNVYVNLAADGYSLTLRYVVDAWKRRSTSSDILGHVIRVFEERGDIFIAPPTLARVEYPLPKE
jgi:small-conductance mechanosensitive channel